eukprot:scaffold121071_cov51-Phaeocystis_antarctica.AAC.2
MDSSRGASSRAATEVAIDLGVAPTSDLSSGDFLLVLLDTHTHAHSESAAPKEAVQRGPGAREPPGGREVMHGSLSVSAALTARSVRMCSPRCCGFHPRRAVFSIRIRPPKVIKDENMGLCSNHHAERAFTAAFG